MITNGACSCGNVRVVVELTRDLSTYGPRVCDCEFCVARSAAYISDSGGSLYIWIEPSRQLRIARQGSMAAEFMLCPDCASLIAVRYQSEGRAFGAVNANILDQPERLGGRTSVSPKHLSLEQKIARWKAAWFAQVEIRSVAV